MVSVAGTSPFWIAKLFTYRIFITMVPARTRTSGLGTGQSLPRLVSKCQTRGKGACPLLSVLRITINENRAKIFVSTVWHHWRDIKVKTSKSFCRGTWRCTTLTGCRYGACNTSTTSGMYWYPRTSMFRLLLDRPKLR